MARFYTLKMDMLLVNKKGYALLETLITLLIITIMLSFSLNKVTNLEVDHFYFMNDYCLKQSEALLNHQYTNIDNGISFNEMGHVNAGKTINIDNHKIVIHLGNGYFVYEN